MNRVTGQRLYLAAYGRRHESIVEPGCRSVLDLHPDDPIASKLDGSLQATNHRPRPRQGCLPGGLDRFVTLPGVIVDMAGFDSVQEAFIELEDVPEVSAHAMGRERWRRRYIGFVVDVLDERDRLAQRPGVLLDQEAVLALPCGILYRCGHERSRSAAPPHYSGIIERLPGISAMNGNNDTSAANRSGIVARRPRDSLAGVSDGGGRARHLHAFRMRVRRAVGAPHVARQPNDREPVRAPRSDGNRDGLDGDRNRLLALGTALRRASESIANVELSGAG